MTTWNSYHNCKIVSF